MSNEIVEKVEQKKVLRGFANRTNQERIEQEERELQELMNPTDEQGEEAEEVAETESEPTSAEERTFKKRYGDLRRHSQKQKEEYEERLANLERQLQESTKKEIKYPSSETELTEWMQQYPDVAKIVETIALKKADERASEFEGRFKEVEDMKLQAKREKAEAELMRLHPDFDDIREADEFHDWVEEQPEWVQNALYDNDTDGRAAARAIDLYKADKGIEKKKAKKPSAKDSAAANVTTKGGSAPSESQGAGKIYESQVNKMDAQTYEKNQDAILEAMRTNNFVYDISGSAR